MSALRKILTYFSPTKSIPKPMKTLFLIRHATAEDGGYTAIFRDFDRNLTSSGIIEAARMGKFLAEKELIPAVIVTSEANRAAETAKLFAEQMGIDTDHILKNEALYGGGPRAYLAVLNNLDEAVKSVAIVGHNPDVTFFGEYLTRDDFGGSMDKASVLVLEFEDAMKWNEVSGKMAKVKAIYSPKSIVAS